MVERVERDLKGFTVNLFQESRVFLFFSKTTNDNPMNLRIRSFTHSQYKFANIWVLF